MAAASVSRVAQTRQTGLDFKQAFNEKVYRPEDDQGRPSAGIVLGREAWAGEARSEPIRHRSDRFRNATRRG